MSRDQLVSVLKTHLQEMHAQFGVLQLALFGSAARDEMRRDSSRNWIFPISRKGDPTSEGPATMNRTRQLTG